MSDEALVKANLVTLSDRRQALTGKLFKKILDNKDSKLRNLLPPQNAKHYNLRKGTQFNLFLRQTGFEIVLLFSTHSRLHYVNLFQNYTLFNSS